MAIPRRDFLEKLFVRTISTTWLGTSLEALSTPLPAAPMLLNYQGRLSNATGTARTGSFSMGFRMVDANGDPLGWTETQTVQVNNGFFAVMLGSVSTLSASIFQGPPNDSFGPVRFLEVTVAGEKLSPNVRILGSAWAIATQAGPTGAAGQQGATGVQGPTGQQGTAGAQGPTGQQGTAGAQGPTGQQGTAGVQGPTGQQGTAGVQGPTGQQGTAGAQGPTGQQGTAGAQGPTGQQGTAGAQGPTGQQGTAGAQGPTGQQGTAGLQGPTGDMGPTGQQGIQGPTGATGPQGIQGIQGPQGPMGP